MITHLKPLSTGNNNWAEYKQEIYVNKFGSVKVTEVQVVHLKLHAEHICHLLLSEIVTEVFKTVPAVAINRKSVNMLLRTYCSV